MKAIPRVDDAEDFFHLCERVWEVQKTCPCLPCRVMQQLKDSAARLLGPRGGDE